MIFLALLIGGLVSAVETKARRFIFWIEFLPKPDRNGVKGSLFALSALVTLISPLAVYVVHSCQRVSEEPKHSQYLAKLYVGTGKGECSCHLDYQRKGQAVTEVELPSPRLAKIVPAKTATISGSLSRSRASRPRKCCGTIPNQPTLPGSSLRSAETERSWTLT